MKKYDPNGSLRSVQRWSDEFTKWRQRSGSLRADLETAETELQEALRKSVSVQDWQARLRAQLSQIVDLFTAIGDADTAIDTETRRATALTDEIKQHQTRRDNLTAPLLLGPSRRTPITLLPMRVEVSWWANILRARIYPDVLSIDSHETRLSETERQAGTAYWSMAGGDDRSGEQAWNNLVKQVGVPRAAWVARQSRPGRGSADAPETAVRAPRARIRLLPDRFVVMMFSAGLPVNLATPGQPPRYTIWGAEIPHDLAVDPLAAVTSPSWVVDFESAIQIGMAVQVPVPPGSPDIHELVVVGVSGTAATGDLADLFDAHAFTDGLEILPDDTPTNNTDIARAARSLRRERDVAANLVGQPPQLGDGSAGTQLAELLGIPRDRLATISGATSRRRDLAAAVRTVVDSCVSASTGNPPPRWRPWLQPAGPAATLRVGRQPYAVAPVTASTRWPISSVPPDPRDAVTETMVWWARALRPLLDVDPGEPAPAVPQPRRITREDDSQLEDLLREPPASAGWISDDGQTSFTGVIGLVGELGGEDNPAHYLELIRQTDVARLGETPVPRPLLGKIAFGAKQATDDVAAVDEALLVLATYATNPEAIERISLLLAQHLDAASLRPDVAVTAACTARLLQGELTGPPAIGCYGYLTDVQPRTRPRSQGHVHAPSIGHAATAAVLRSAYLAPTSAPSGPLREARRSLDAARWALAAWDGDTASSRAPEPHRDAGRARLAAHLDRAHRELVAAGDSAGSSDRAAARAINLSSQRVRKARLVLTAVRRGQSLAAVLGYQFERDLAESGLSRYLEAFRKLTRFRTGTALEELERIRREKAELVADQLKELHRREGVRDDLKVAWDAALLLWQAAEAARAQAQAAAGLFVRLRMELTDLTKVADTNDPATSDGTIKQLERELAGLSAPPHVTTHHRVRAPKRDPDGVVQDRRDTELHEFDLIDPDQDAGFDPWATRRGQLQRDLDAARARAETLNTVLAAEPARTLLATLDGLAADATAGRKTADEAEADYQTAAASVENFKKPQSELGQALETLAKARKDVADELARLLAESTASASLTATVDGLALSRRYRAGSSGPQHRWDMSTIPFRQQDQEPSDADINLPVVDGPGYPELMAALDRLDEAVDAVADLVAAEAIHQHVAGNPVRAGAALDVAASGAVPDRIAVISTPQPAVDISHRLMVLGAPGASPLWGQPTDVSDPAVAAWLSTLLPDPQTVHFVVERRVDGGVTEQLPLSADILGLDQAGWLRVSGNRGELYARIAWIARRRWADTNPNRLADGTVTVRDTGALGSDLGLSDMISVADAARALLARARALTAADLASPGGRVDDDAEAVAEATARIRQAEAHLAAVISALTTSSRPDATLAQTVDALFGAAAVGVPDAVPALDSGVPSVDELRARASAATTILQRRLANASPQPDPENATGKIARARQRLQGLTGAPSLLLTGVASPAGPIASADLSHGPFRIKDVDAAAIRHWLQQQAHVRPAIDALHQLYDAAQALDLPARLDVRVTQLPTSADDTWFPKAGLSRPGGVGITAVCTYPRTLPGRVTGVVVDSWAQAVPCDTRFTGLSFHYDQPNAAAPHAILIATPPDLGESGPATWDLDTLIETVTSTVRLAQLRAAAHRDAQPTAAINLEIPT